MKRERARVVLNRMLKEIKIITDATKDFKSCDDMDEVHKLAIAMTFVYLGELAQYLPPDLIKSKKRENLFYALKATRNTMAHKYDSLSSELILQTLRKDLPKLKDGVEELLEVVKEELKKTDENKTSESTAQITMN